MIALLRSTAGLQPSTVPSSVANRKRLLPDEVPLLTWKSLVGLKTVPVGVPVKGPPGGSPGAGMCTVRPILVPEPS
jgi:hypothetical protein